MVFWILPDLNQIPHVVLAGLVIASAVQFRFQRLSGILFHAIAGALLFIFPGVLHEPTVSGNFDSVHVFLQRFSGAFHLGYALFNYRNRYDNVRVDPAVHFSKAILSGLLVVTQLLTAYQLYESKARGLIISPNFLSCVLLVDGVWFAVEVSRLVNTLSKNTLADEIDLMCKRTQRWIEGRTSQDAQILFWADAAIAFSSAFFNYAFAEQVLKVSIRREYAIDGIDVMFNREFGCQALAIAITSFVASQFTVRHQKNYILQRIATQALVFVLNIYGHFVLGVYSTNHVIPLVISGFYIALLVSICYRVQHEELAEIEFDEANGGPNRLTTFTVKKSTTKAA